MDTENLLGFLQILDEFTYMLRAHQHQDMSKVHSNTWWDHIHPEGTSMQQHYQDSVKYSMRSRTGCGHIHAATLAEFNQIFDKITYVLRANRHHGISRVQRNTHVTYSLMAHQRRKINGVHPNTWQDHILAKYISTPGHYQSLFKCSTKLRTRWGHIDATTLVELIWILNTWRDDIHPEGTCTLRP
jgi:hypothetical protein